MTENKAKRSRPIMKRFFVDEKEDILIKKRMDKAKIENFSHFARELVFKGQIKVIDFEAIKQLRLEVNRIGVNINQVVKVIHENGGLIGHELDQLLAYQKELEKAVNQVIKVSLKNHHRKEKANGCD
ncbi:plasmid mobilization protein [Streptococcus sp. S784/96/1]|uniref:plasmid mobilization protein n=1 Tax=Streptococcus sp. S784/96/1 TaxID=2653499 RepID=UPI0013868873|nr:plasmid mobilization relaxosome protein MobC [Streptococcus sp. S784/96/1]